MRVQEFDFSVPILDALIWEDDQTSRLKTLLVEKNEWYRENHTQFWEDWYTNVFNLLTANEFGLTVWSIILDQPLSFGQPPDPPGKPIWGFGDFNKNFGNGNFGNGGDNIGLSIEEKRLILRLKYYKLISRGAIPEINKFLKELFDVPAYGVAYVLDGLDMSMTYVFKFRMNVNLKFFIEHFDLLPRPEGVLIKYQIIDGPVWGFGDFNQNYENGNFPPEF